MQPAYLPANYDLVLVGLSFMLAVMASYAALGLGARIPHVGSERIPYWLVGGACAMGIGIWSMHFMGMLAFHLPIPLAYDLRLTTASVLIAILASGVALFVIRKGLTSPSKLLVSSLLMGGGIGGMHYTGMAALRMSPPIDYDPVLVLLSLVIAVTASYYAIRLSFAASRAAHFIFTLPSLLSALVMGVAIAGMHYTGMFAARFPFGSVCRATEGGMDPTLLTVSTALASFSVLLFTLLMIVFDARLAAKDATMLVTLKQQNEQLEQRATQLAEKMTQQIRESARHHRLLAAIVEQAAIAIFTSDRDGRITRWNSGAERLFGFHANEATGMQLGEFRSDMEVDDAYTREDLRGVIRERFLPVRDKGRRVRYVDMSSSHLFDQWATVIGDVHIVQDVTAEKEAYDKLLLMREVIQNSGEAIVITDSRNRIVSVNAAFTEITGYSSEEAIGQTPSLLSSGRHDSAFYKDMWQQLMEQGSWRGEIWNRRKNGEIYPEWLTITLLRDYRGNVRNYIAIFTDVSQYKAREAEIEFLAHHDTLTHLPNRLLLRDRLEQAIIHSRRHRTQVALLFLDLDRFKNINDSLGHEIGDRLLVEIGQRLRSIVREEDTVSRQGGDEFIIIMTGLESSQQVMALAERLLHGVSAKVQIEGHQVSVTPSIGISLYPDDARNIDELISKADAAMYHAKETGRATYQFFTEDLNKEIQLRIRIETALRRSLDEQRFHLVYQPLHDLRSGQVVGAEALLRCSGDGGRDPFSPGQFIPIAEENGLIIPIGEWVVGEACRQLAAWRAAGLEPPRISINLSARQLDDGSVIDLLYQTLLQHGIPASFVEVELTESAIMKNVALSRKRLDQIKELGIAVAVDDFGTGYSSLSYLQRLPIDVLKIDSSFVNAIARDHSSHSLTRAIINLARGLKLSTVAEGIETREQLEHLKQLGCAVGQGYFLCRPLPADSFADYLREHRVA